MSSRASAWTPAVVWALVIFMMSTDAMSAAHTQSLIEPVLRLFLPSLTRDQFEIFHIFARKLAHVSEYFVFALLLDRGFRRDSPLSPSRAPLAALVAAALYSLTDEGHQAFVANRTPSLVDCGFDSVGAAVGSLLATARGRARRVDPATCS